MINKKESSLLVEYVKLKTDSDEIKKEIAELKEQYIDLKEKCELWSCNRSEDIKEREKERDIIAKLHQLYVQGCRKTEDRQKKYVEEKSSFDKKTSHLG